ncbi:MAG: TIGR01777 family oxidoreductase [Kiritimatiellae bacterium]|nr:TIGR01777 family oxidoreductase [Kiritimatiellia bacterium]
MSSHKNILVTGAKGLIGSALCRELIKQGYTVRTLSRSHGNFRWNIESGYIDTNILSEIDSVVHLAGETIAQRWTTKAKERIVLSRINSTQLLVREILKQKHPIDYISASGINFYGDGFLAQLCRQWEGAAQPLQETGLRTVFIRTGVVLSSEGGALAKMLPPFKACLGGKIGSGKQLMSWISLMDIIRVYILAIENASLAGPINAVSEKAVSNEDFTRALSQALHRPAVFPLPAFLVNLIFGEMGRETVLCDLNIFPEKLQQFGFEWEQPDLFSLLQTETE